jgi:hypothetical protein
MHNDSIGHGFLYIAKNSVYILSCTTKKCQNWHFLVVMAWRHELNLPSSHYRKVPILAKIRNDMEEIKRDRYLKQLIDSQQNGFIKVE